MLTSKGQKTSKSSVGQFEELRFGVEKYEWKGISLRLNRILMQVMIKKESGWFLNFTLIE